MILETYRTHFKQALVALHPQEEVDAITAIALQFVLKKSRVEVALSRKQELSPSQKTALDTILERLLKEEPIQYITGSTQFYGLELKVNPDTLIPRPETEELVDWILKEAVVSKTDARLLDIGTGSGCIAIAIAKNATRVAVSAIDISEKAIETARDNAQVNQVVVHFVHKDILAVNTLPDTYDIIVSNPPYVRALEKAEIKKNVLQYEPHTALFVADTNPLLFYRKITALALQYLKPKGVLFFEINEYLGEETVALVKEMGFHEVVLRKDMFGKDRMLKATKI